jgi:ATP-dependent helicase YprA (DUF1998 family)
MAFDVFALRDRVVAEYRDYVESFINIRDKRLEAFVGTKLEEGELWPEAVLQLKRFFGEDLSLYRHQREALDIYRRGEPYVVSTGTGSGKSLTYLIPIFDHVLHNQAERHSVRALVVYPMNALINSQMDALETFQRENWPDCPVRFAKYTGETRRDVRPEMLTDPPHVLLTNYVMLEYMLIRPQERALIQQATRELAFLAVDELHVYRGRQGADVAMLIRRLRQRDGRADLRFIGTSATIVSGSGRAERRARIAEVGTRLFGVTVAQENVIDETLQRVAEVAAPATLAEIRAAVERPPPARTRDDVVQHPLAAWVEETFGIWRDGGRLVRRPPIAFADGLRKLADDSGLDEELCRERLMAVLEAGSEARLPSGEPVFAFRLHQFLASGGSVYTTVEPPDVRECSTDGQYYAPGESGVAGHKVLFPLAFCREWGHEHTLASRVEADDGELLVPRSPVLNAPDDEVPGTPGFFSIAHDGLWAEDEDYPDAWTEERRDGLRVKRHYAVHVPQRLWVSADGRRGRRRRRRLLATASSDDVPALSCLVRPG